MNDSDDRAISVFAGTAEEYCAWAERAPSDANAEARHARKLLIDLLRGAITLPNVSSEALVAKIGDAEYKRVYERFGVLPFNYYSECFNPLVVPAEEAVVADLADDLADIWRDLKPGLSLWKEGSRNAAAWHWRFHFEAHWGHHATGALYALQSWFAQHVDDLDA